MKIHEKNILTLFIIGAFATAWILLAISLLKDCRGNLVFSVSITKYLMETVCHEDSLNTRIDYADPLLNERKVLITMDFDVKHTQDVMNLLLYPLAQFAGQNICTRLLLLLRRHDCPRERYRRTLHLLPLQGHSPHSTIWIRNVRRNLQPRKIGAKHE